MRIGTVLKIAALLVVALAVAGVVVVQNMDFNQYKGLIAAKVKEATGRDLAINGDLKLDILTLSPSLVVNDVRFANRSEEHTSELQSLMRISYAVFCFKKKSTQTHIHQL